jgi:hypothetical protein
MDGELKFVDEVRVLRHLNAVLDSKYFCNAPRLREFLRFIVTETLARRGDQIKEYSIGVNVYGRKPDFDPKEDSIVRVEAVKLRARLAEYYDQASATDGIKIRLLKGGYIPTFSQISSQYESSLIAELCAAGEFAVSRRTAAATVLARQHFSRIIELASSDPRGHIGWASACRSGLDTELENPAEIIPRYERELAESLRLSPKSSYAQSTKSMRLSDSIRGTPLHIFGEPVSWLLAETLPRRFRRYVRPSASNQCPNSLMYILEEFCSTPASTNKLSKN